ncbi:hypothetical protein SFRURICE_014177 [Spodoptera frugiperda]|nr:hypothetical protein SFRURICE_014177 [Spodoptera frugiperda]
MRWLHTVAVACLLHAAAPAEYLLPGDVVPSHYHLKYAFDIDPATNFSYFGVVDISLNVKKATSKIVLHANDILIADPIIRSGDTPSHKVTGYKVNDTYSLMTITLDQELQQDENYTLTIPFYGNIKHGLDGAYISTYVDQMTKKKEYLITTQFEAISARKAFPCFDEPMYKATYSIVIGHHKDYTAISNMPLENSVSENALEDHWPWSQIEKKFKKPKSDFVWDSYEKSVAMSTYLLAFVVSKFSFVQSPSDLSNTKFRIWARPDALDQTAYASTTGPKALTYFEQWFNLSYPLPKQDMIAIPDFASGAMENWGLITYREKDLLYDEKQSSFLNKERVATVIAHELAHQWFGNLVTMKWWSDLWLNEGFATFAATVAVNHVEPTWNADKSSAVNDMLLILNLDSLESSHPVSVPIDDPKRISEIFDDISYQKGSTLIRMMTMFLGDEVFRKAINNYLRKYSYDNAEQDDLWRELTAVSKKYGVLPGNVTVKDIMDTWTTQTGYPILTVTRDYEDKSLTVSQRRYLSLAARSTSLTSWWVPLSVVCEPETRGAPPALRWLAANQGLTSLHRFEHGAERDQWLLFNHDMIAPYRVNYDPRNWQLLSNALKSNDYTRVPLLGRVQLLSDAFALAWTNHLDYSTALNLASYLQHETEYLPLYTGLRGLMQIENVLKRSPDYGAFQKFVRKLIGEIYERSGGLATKKIINGHDLNSATISSWACRMKVPGCEENAIQLYKQWMDTEKPDENNPYLEWTVTEGSGVRKQDVLPVIVNIIRSPVGYYVAKDFIYTRVDEIYNTFKGQYRRMGEMIKTLLQQFTTQRELDEFLEWREKNAQYLVDSKLAVNQAIENAQVNINWITKNRKTVVDKLREFSTPRRQPGTPWKGQPSFMSSIFAIHNISRARLRPFEALKRNRTHINLSAHSAAISCNVQISTALIPLYLHFMRN